MDNNDFNLFYSQSKLTRSNDFFKLKKSRVKICAVKNVIQLIQAKRQQFCSVFSPVYNFTTTIIYLMLFTVTVVSLETGKVLLHGWCLAVCGAKGTGQRSAQCSGTPKDTTKASKALSRLSESLSLVTKFSTVVT